jgi:cytochrome c peroxidase
MIGLWSLYTISATAAEPVSPPVVPAPAPAGPHGAAPMADQVQRADVLVGQVDLARAPKGVDPKIWDFLLPDDPKPTPELVALGKKVYFETALSRVGTVACATCHDVTRAFTDKRPTSEGVGDALGRRNAPTTLNAVFLTTQFWDGRAATLEEQAKQPILNAIEMGQPDEAAAVAALSKAGYDAEFQAVFGRKLSYDDVARAIAAYERTLVFLDAPFDAWLSGQQDAISPSAQRGFELFSGKARCSGCHPINGSNPSGSDNRFHNIGVSAREENFEALAIQALGVLKQDPSAEKLDELAISTDFSALGRFMVTRNFADIGAFRSSQLRNIGITGPYMHDGTLQSLWDVMDHYNKGGEANRWLDGGIEPLALTESEVDDLVAFMFTLTDRRFSDLNASEMEAQRAHALEARPFRDDALAQRKVFAQDVQTTPAGGE